MKVLVLGWEYPPAVAGGLGAACHGLTNGLAERGHDVTLAVPMDSEESRALAEAADHPGIRRVWLGASGGAATGTGNATRRQPLTPYVFDGPGPTAGEFGTPEAACSDGRGEGHVGDEGAVSTRVGASRRLYGGDLAEAVAAYSDDAVRTLSNLDVDVIHAHDWMTIPAASRLRLALRRPVCLHVHSTAFDRTGSSHPAGRHSIAAVERAGARTADRLIAVSAYTRTVLEREYGADPARISVVHNAAPASVPASTPASTFGQARDATSRGSAPGEPPTVLFLARLTRQKGAGFFVRAAARVHGERPDVRFVVAGEGEDRAALIEQSAGLGIAHRMFFPGSIGDAARDDLYRDSTLFVLSSISEPFGLTPLEALRQGTPSVLTENCGVREVLPSAPVVAPWDAAGLAKEILDVVASPARRKQLVEAGLRDIEPLTWQRSAIALEHALSLSMAPAVVAASQRQERPA